MARDKAPKAAAHKSPQQLTPELDALQSSMREALGLKTVFSGNERRGKITLSYSSAEELEHLYEVIGRLLG